MRMIGSVVKKTWFSQPEELHNQIISDQMRAIHVDDRVGLLGFYPMLLYKQESWRGTGLFLKGPQRNWNDIHS